MPIKTETWVALFDIHYPLVDWPTFRAALSFIQENKIAGLILGGDQLDNADIAHHNANKPLYKPQGSYKRNTEGFDRKVLTPLEEALNKKAERIWIIGNHDRFEFDLIETQPELEGVIERPTALNLVSRGWEIVPLGHAYKLGKLSVIHGEILTGIGNQAGVYPSRKAVELYAGNVLAGHTHAPQSFTKVSPVEDSNKWMGWIAPILGHTNPTYLRNRPTAWVNGFVVIEKMDNGFFNLYPIVVSKGRFSYGGKTYEG